MENKWKHDLKQVAIRMVDMPPLVSEVPLNNPQAVIQLLADTFHEYDREVVAIVNLKSNLQPISMNIVSMGALDQSIVHPREVMKTAILSNASSILMAHFHPSGNMNPSKEDVIITDRMNQVCSLMGIKLIDHVIVGAKDKYYSFQEKGTIPFSNMQFTEDIDKIELEGMKVAESATMTKPDKTESKRVVSFTVAECGEFHNLGELHENVATLKEAIELFNQIPPDRMNGIPTIAVRVTDSERPELFTEIDIMTGKRIDVDILGYVPDIGENGQAQFAIAEMIHQFPEKEIIGKVPETIEKKLQIIESREKQSEQLKDVMTQLEQGVQGIFNSEDYKRFLDVMAKLPTYSLNNMLLIAIQTEGKASMCQSFTGWKSMGRYVKKGEKGIKILAPSPYTIQREQNKLDKATGQPIVDHDGEPVKETVDITMKAFRVVRTFDISQTDGKEIPSIGVDELVGNIEGYCTLMEAIKTVCPVPIYFEDIDSGAKGFYHQTEKRIAIQDGMSEVQTVKTAIHEMAHQKLHAKEDINILDVTQSRNSKEVEAESVAYAVCQHYGINTSDYSFGYVAGWSEGKQLPELKKSLDTIRVTAAEMITSIDTELEHVRERIALGADTFTKIYMEDQDRGNLMIGEYASSLNIDSNLTKDAVIEIQDKIENFLQTEVHSEDEIKQLGKELLTTAKRDDGEFNFNGENLLGEKGTTPSSVEKRPVDSLVSSLVEKITQNAESNGFTRVNNQSGKAEEPEKKDPKKRTSVKGKLKEESKKKAQAKKPKVTKAKEERA